jgi:hypothetical protein
MQDEQIAVAQLLRRQGAGGRAPPHTKDLRRT